MGEQPQPPNDNPDEDEFPTLGLGHSAESNPTSDHPASPRPVAPDLDEGSVFAFPSDLTPPEPPIEIILGDEDTAPPLPSITDETSDADLQIIIHPDEPTHLELGSESAPLDETGSGQPPETISSWIEEVGQPDQFSDDEPTITVTVDDLFKPDGALSEASDAYDSDQFDTLPPRPIMTERDLPSSGAQNGPNSDDEETPAMPMPPVVPPRPVSTETHYGSRDGGTDEREPLIRPPLTERDQEATVVNPRRAFYSESEEQRAREVEEIRRRRRATREAAQQATVQSTPQAAQPTRVATRRDYEQRQAASPVRAAPPETAKRVVLPAQDKKKKRQRNSLGCFMRWLIISFLLLLFIVVGTAAALTIGYVVIAGDLPSVREIETRTSKFETIFIYDADGNELYSVADPTTGNRTYVPFDRIDQDLINGTIATEDSRFYENFGFDPIAIGRAVSEVVLSGAITRGEIAAAGGASTITQQLVRATLLDEEERGQQTVMRKIREIILSAELNRTLTRELGEIEGRNKILELYLNEIYYGNRAYGIEAAAQTYYKKPAADLTLAEAALLAGLPQAPALWDPVTAPEFAEGRQKEVLELMVSSGYVAKMDAQTALNERLAFAIEAPVANIDYPHFTLGVLAELENTYGSQELYGGGFRVYTTIRPNIQRLAEEVMTQQRGNIQNWGANNGAMVVIDPGSAEILALVGSLDYRDDAISGQVNMVRAARQPGSTIKPFVYLAGMERGMTPATLFWDVPSAFPDGTNPAYEPKNYDNDFHGPMLLRTALANSYNIPAVKALEFVGVCNFVQRAQNWGLGLSDDGCIEQGQPRNYGLALSLGGGAVSPLQMAGAFAMLANGGESVQPVSIRSIINKDGQEIYANPQATEQPADTGEVAVTVSGVSPDLAFLTSSVLSDNDARIPEFTADNLLNIPGYTVAAKTGTSGTDAFDVRDAWTIGYTPELVAAVWVGNTDNQPLAEGASGYRVASPIWNSFMTQALSQRQNVQFSPPSTVTTFEICADSGVQPTPNCEFRRQEYFSRGAVPLSAENHFLRSVLVDRWTLNIANENCNDADQIRIDNFDLLVSGYDPAIQGRYRQEVANWLNGNGRWWADRYGLTLPLSQSNLLTNQACQPGVQRPIAQIQQPFQGETVQGFVQIGGQATAPGFAGYELEYGFGEAPGQWFKVGDFQSSPQPGGLLGILNTDDLGQGGVITLRLVMFGTDNPYTPNFVDRARKESTVQIVVPQPTGVPVPTPTNTPQPTDLPPTQTPTEVPTVVAVPTDTPATEVPTPVPAASDVPTVAPVASPTPEAPTPEPVDEPTPEPTATSDLVLPATREPTVTPEP